MDKESMPLTERLRSIAAGSLYGATTRRIAQLDMIEAADLIDKLRQRVAEAEDELVSTRDDRETYAIENDELRAKLALAEQDARRYRWLRDNAASAPGNTPCPYRWTNSDVPETVNGDFLDSEIDAAMRAAIDASGEGHAK